MPKNKITLKPLVSLRSAKSMTSSRHTRGPSGGAIRVYPLLLLITICSVGLFIPHAVRASLEPTHAQEGLLTPTVIVPTLASPLSRTATSRPSLVHVVTAGDTLSGIASQYNVTVAQIIETNQLRDPSYLFIGQRLMIYTAAATAAVTPTPVLSAPTIAAPRSVAPQPFADELICPGNTRAFPLTLPADPIHIHLVGDQLLLIADGDLYQIPIDSLVDGAALTPTNLMPPARMIEGYTVRELVYATVDKGDGDLFVLDKTNDIYRYSSAGQWTMAFPAAPVPDQFPDPQYLAIQVDERGAYALDADLSRIWALREGVAIPQVTMQASQLLTGVDFVMLNNGDQALTFGVLLRDGSIKQFGQGAPRAMTGATANPAGHPWPAQLLLADDTLYAVDGESREITSIDPQTQQRVRKISFRLPNLQRLRSAVVQADRVYAVAGRTLYVSERQDKETCPAVRYDNHYYFAGHNLQELFVDFQLPYPGTLLPDRPRSYPGARRLYRYGVHEGLDIYGFDAAGLHFGSSVWSVAPGVVARADHDFVELSPAAYEAAIAQAALEHRTPSSLADRFLGRQVAIEHNHGVESRYTHLQAIALGIAVGEPITQGMAIGTVGVSGTYAGAYGTTDGTHLHFELWINGRYLGQGLSLYETMRLWQAVFGQP